MRICELKGKLGLSKSGSLENDLNPTGDFIYAKDCGLFKPELSYVNRSQPTQTLYGIDIRNRCGFPMYVWLFYFDCSTLQISKRRFGLSSITALY